MTGRKQWIQSLPITFWLLYICGLSTLSGFWLFYLEGVLEWNRVLPALWYTTAPFVLIYFVIASRVVWKSAATYMRSPLLRKRIWGWTARSFVVFWALLTLRGAHARSPGCPSHRGGCFDARRGLASPTLTKRSP
jgi:hypothetical protein